MDPALGPLAGVPFAVKNLFDVAGLATRAGSKINRDHEYRSQGGINRRNQDLCARIFAKYSIGLMSLTPEEQAAASHCK